MSTATAVAAPRPLPGYAPAGVPVFLGFILLLDLADVTPFEMPIPGLGGFPAFAVACFTMCVAARRLLWPGAERAVAL